MFRIQTKGLSINDRRIDQGLVDFLKLFLENGISFYVPANVIYHRLLSHERIGDGHSWMLYYVLSGKRVGPVDDIFLYSVKVHELPCRALWELRKDLIVVTKTREPSVLRCLRAKGSSYKEVLIDNPNIRGTLGVSLKNLRSYHFFVSKSRSEKFFSLMN